MTQLEGRAQTREERVVLEVGRYAWMEARDLDLGSTLAFGVLGLLVDLFELEAPVRREILGPLVDIDR